MHCPGCGLIIGRDAPPELCRCPRCARALRVLALVVEDDLERRELRPLEVGRCLRVALYVSEAMLRFLLSTRTRRPAQWEPLLVELEEERLRAFAREVGFETAGVHRDPGPGAREAARPFARIAAELADGAADALLVSDFERVPRRDLHALAGLARAHGAELLSLAPHPVDENLRLEDVDHDSVPDSCADVPELERLWREPATAALRDLFAVLGWHWTHYAADALARALGVDEVRAWRASDPRCREGRWRDALTRFAVARARRTGELHRLPVPALAPCALCRRRALDAALPLRLKELVAGRTPYCRTCLVRAFSHPPDAGAEFVGPPGLDRAADHEAAQAFLHDLPRERFHALLQRLVERPRDARAPGQTPSSAWLGALLDLGLVRPAAPVVRGDGFWKGADGHLLPSLGAALLDAWLAARGAPHRLDARYPRDGELDPAGCLRADFLVGGTRIEFMGLRGRDEFRKGLERRHELLRRAGEPLVAVWAEDLLVPEVLERKLLPLVVGEEPGEKAS